MMSAECGQGQARRPALDAARVKDLAHCGREPSLRETPFTMRSSSSTEIPVREATSWKFDHVKKRRSSAEWMLLAPSCCTAISLTTPSATIALIRGIRARQPLLVLDSGASGGAGALAGFLMKARHSITSCAQTFT